MEAQILLFAYKSVLFVKSLDDFNIHNSFCGLNHCPSEVGAKIMEFSIVFSKKKLKSSRSSSSFSTKLPLCLVGMKSLQFVILLDKKGLAVSQKFFFDVS